MTSPSTCYRKGLRSTEALAVCSPKNFLTQFPELLHLRLLMNIPDMRHGSCQRQPCRIYFQILSSIYRNLPHGLSCNSEKPAHLSSILFADTICTHYRVRFYPPFGYSISDKECNFYWVQPPKNPTHLWQWCNTRPIRIENLSGFAVLLWLFRDNGK